MSSQHQHRDGDIVNGKRWITVETMLMKKKVGTYVNKLTYDQLKEDLISANLSSSGVKKVLQVRLKHHMYANIQHSSSNKSNGNSNSNRNKKKGKKGKKGKNGVLWKVVGNPSSRCHLGYKVDYLCIVDFEATCDEEDKKELHGKNDYPHEIIEFPVVLLNVRTLQVEAEFQAYVRPVHNVTLSDFCTSLTGITQDKVANADTFETVFHQMLAWLDGHKLRFFKYASDPLSNVEIFENAQKQYKKSTDADIDVDFNCLSLDIEDPQAEEDTSEDGDVDTEGCNDDDSGDDDDDGVRTFVFATDGPWDMQKFMQLQCRISNLAPLPLTSCWVNLREHFSRFYQCRFNNITSMLYTLGMQFEGNQHCGLDDSRNITRLFRQLIIDGWEPFVPNVVQYFNNSHEGSVDNAFQRYLRERRERSTE